MSKLSRTSSEVILWRKLLARYAIVLFSLLYMAEFLLQGGIFPKTSMFELLYIYGLFTFIFLNMILVVIIIFRFRSLSILILPPLLFLSIESPRISSAIWFALYGYNVVPVCNDQYCVFINDLIDRSSNAKCSQFHGSFGYCEATASFYGPCLTRVLYMPEDTFQATGKAAVDNRESQFTNLDTEETSESYAYNLRHGRVRIEHLCSNW
jgi:hypothetical protein